MTEARGDESAAVQHDARHHAQQSVQDGPSAHEGAARAATASAQGPLAQPFAAKPVQTPSEYRTLAGLLLGAAFLILGNGLFQTLIPLRLVRHGESTLVVGFIQSCYYLGFLLGAFTARRLIDRFGQHRVFIAFAALATILTQAFGAFELAATLGLIRLATGFAFMGLFSSIESWIQGTASNANRGRIFGTYTTINYFSLCTGQLLLNVGGPAGTTGFGLASALFAAAIIPVALLSGWPRMATGDANPSARPHSWIEVLRALTGATSLAVPGCIIAGFLYSGFYSLMPVFLVRSGFATANLSLFMGVCLLGALFTQRPMGRLSDRYARRVLVYRIALLSAALSAALLIFHEGAFLWLGAIAYVAVTFTQYGLVAGDTNDRIDPPLRVAIASLLLVLFSVGGMTGPAIASVFMTVLGPKGIFAYNGLSCLALAWAARRSRERITAC
ncbi:MFS transporter [Paraburkholderia acidisoli]|uniref:MFS transporter n=1 Tax=Paraburkholderia acidisoli TaxID=2571748 RepID=A0A7Z2JJX2_9BURK|nr:MFS transporter [Paraburkholderia acidisoli]QGZ66713.1 MFS transporter [Paraburkholderia acidisoli]